MGDAGTVLFRAPRQRVTDALAVFRALPLRSGQGEAVLGFREGELVVGIGGRTVHVTGEGFSCGEARLPARVVLVMARDLPQGDPVEFRAVKGHLRVNGLEVACTWQSERERPVAIPVNATLSYLMAIALRHPGSDIAKSGATEVVRKAEERAERIMQRAAKTLAPLEVELDDLKRLVYASIRRRWPVV